MQSDTGPYTGTVMLSKSNWLLEIHFHSIETYIIVIFSKYFNQQKNSYICSLNASLDAGLA